VLFELLQATGPRGVGAPEVALIVFCGFIILVVFLAAVLAVMLLFRAVDRAIFHR